MSEKTRRTEEDRRHPRNTSGKEDESCETEDPRSSGTD